MLNKPAFLADYGFEDLWDSRKGWFWRYELFLPNVLNRLQVWRLVSLRRGRSMKRSSLLVRMLFPSFGLSHSPSWLGLSTINLVHQPLSLLLKAIAKRLSVKLATLFSLISKIRNHLDQFDPADRCPSYAENPSQDKVKEIRDLFWPSWRGRPGLESGGTGPKSGQLISTDDTVQMKTSSDMMTEDWYQKAIHQGC